MKACSCHTSADRVALVGCDVELVPDSKVVQVVEFETDDPSMMGEMMIRYSLAEATDGTDLVGVHEGLPPGVSPADNELGWRISIDKLATLAERDQPTPSTD